ncbi:suppressor of cytokine signaling 2-like [Xenia sp. Carnegie-2017]|uniref:suppressor of cytokine signaling 2-like n=1 Tax=Xenia sp. Carnegie-2017 TaxID=2897299 RepID=UPI001F0363EB|nr:suppressor of cytokine signaling 2-like [Xenia sp. Carnegie-2017]
MVCRLINRVVRYDMNEELRRKERLNEYYSRLQSHDCISNLFRVSLARVEDSCWYWGTISNKEASFVLRNSEEGTFLLRDSSDSRYYFSLSVKVHETILNIRVLYSNGKFMFDCFKTRLNDIPKFDCVIKLISYYVAVSQTEDGRRILTKSAEHGETEIRLQKPRFSKVPSLEHLCRRVVNRSWNKDEQCSLALTRGIDKYIRQYPYSI